MKIIVSHDVDHLTVWEHLTKDLILPKFLIRSKLELLTGKISFTEYFCRLNDFFKNKWNGVDEVIAFNNSRGIKSTFFVGVNNALGLSYPLAEAAHCVKNIINQGFEAGVHGISFDEAAAVKREHELFEQIVSTTQFGIRMHYLRNNKDTFSYLEKAGYLYDATERGMKNPYKIGSMWEFPVQLMDGWIMDGNKRWQIRNIQQAKDETYKYIEEAQQKNLKYFSLLFHDRYFSKSFKTWMDWYIWIIDYLITNRFQFIDHRGAVEELNTKKS